MKYNLIICLSKLENKVKDAQVLFNIANEDRIRAEKDFITQLNALNNQMVDIAGKPSMDDLSHRKLYLRLLLLIKFSDFVILR